MVHQMGGSGHMPQAWGLGLARAKQDPNRWGGLLGKKSRTYNGVGHWAYQEGSGHDLTSPMA